ncbi:MAG: CPBP family intramembrane metalloprotease [Puniceicoccales bacterium]|jgi:membrane protease YdiL (CAAX protease family)|nr:CPBP family intramembrane metalloprotease [Puniceicoccales bacterium]
MDKNRGLCPIGMTQGRFFGAIAGLFWVAFLMPVLLGRRLADPVMKLCIVGSLQYIFGIIFLFWFARRERWPAIDPSGMDPVKIFFIGVVGELVFYPFVTIVGALWQKILLSLRYALNINFSEQPLIALLRSGLTEERQFWAILFLAVILAPIAEELFFRYFFYRFCKLKLPSFWAMFWTALVFAALHFNLAAFVPLFIMGIFLVLCYERYGHLGPCMVFHGIHNYMTIIAALTLPDNLWLGFC